MSHTIAATTLVDSKPSAESQESFLVFVYGTLMKGEGNHRLLEQDGAEFVGEATTSRPEYRLLNLGHFPCAWAPRKSKGWIIKGELYRVNKSMMRSLDMLEGCPHLYIRHLVDVDCGPITEPAWIYVYNRAPHKHRPMKSGDWRKRKSPRW